VGGFDEKTIRDNWRGGGREQAAETIEPVILLELSAP
jgi:hypothetical protein